MSTTVDVCRIVVHIYNYCELSYPQGVYKSVDKIHLFTGVVGNRRNYNNRNSKVTAMHLWLSTM